MSSSNAPSSSVPGNSEVENTGTLELRSPDLFEYLCRLGDDRIVLGHRLSGWCSRGPTLEEDIALANMALDELGQGTIFLRMAGKAEGAGRDEDQLAFFRDVTQFRNCALVEQENGDFAKTIVRQFLFSAYAVVHMQQLVKVSLGELSGVAAKCVKESSYHFRHSAEWLVRLGDGTVESRSRAQNALSELWRFTGELFLTDALEQRVAAEYGIPLSNGIVTAWYDLVTPVLRQAGLDVPSSEIKMALPVRSGRHSESLGRMLSEMQSVARAHPGAQW